jgi:hypothetical protein
MGLSKSKFIAGWQCLKRLYLEVHQPELVGEPDEQTMAVFEQGHEVGRWAGWRRAAFQALRLLGARLSAADLQNRLALRLLTHEQITGTKLSADWRKKQTRVRIGSRV